MRVKLGVWIRNNDSHVYGDGRQALLERIERFGSISKAAADMEMSYRAAWGKIKATEDSLGIKLLERTVGGKTGGGATLTEEAKRLMKAYSDFRGGLDEMLNKRFADKLTENKLML